jgi:hypothetical protein
MHIKEITMKKFMILLALVLLPMLSSAASVTAPISLNVPSQECRAQSVVTYQYATKGNGTYTLDVSGLAKYLYTSLTSADSAVMIDVAFGTDTGTWRASSGTFAASKSTAPTFTFNNTSTATPPKLRIVKCY